MKTLTANKSSVENIKRFIAMTCVILAWLYSYSAVGSPDAMQQLFMLGMLSFAILFFGVYPLPIAIASFLAMMLLLLVLSPTPYVSRQIAGAAGLLVFGLAIQGGIKFRHDSSGFIYFLIAIVTAAFVNAVEGLLQWSDLVGELHRWVVVPENRGVAFGAFRQRNVFSTFLIIGSICTAWLVQKRSLSEPMAWFITAVLMIAVAASGSRTGALEAVVLALMSVFWRSLHLRAVTRLLLGQLGILLLALSLLPHVASSLGFEFSPGSSRAVQAAQDPRLSIWSNSIDLILQRPLTGWGWREFGYGHYMSEIKERHFELLENAHNLPLQIAVEFGLPVTVLLMGWALKAVVMAKPWRLDKRPEDTFAWGILLCVVGVHSMLEFPLWNIGMLFLTGTVMGYLLPELGANVKTPWVNTWRTNISYLLLIGLVGLALSARLQFEKVVEIYRAPFTNDKAVVKTAIAAALANASESWLFQEQMDFIKLNQSVVTQNNAVETRELAEKLLHSSAEPRVIQPLLLSLWYAGDLKALRFHAFRFCHTFPSAYERWYIHPASRRIIETSNLIAPACNK